MEDKTMLLEALNQFTRRAHTLDEVYLFDVILCDNEIDRDGDCFSESALAELQKLFVGVTGIFDHDARSGNQTARIFRTELVTDPSRKTQNGHDYCCLKANAYMIRTDANRDLIREIEGGIKREVSISCAVSVQKCSVCGANRLKKACTHIKGRSYAGGVCHTVLEGITDVYEWSFVAVPAQRNAGVVKTCGGTACDAEKVAMRRTMIEMADLLDRMTGELRREVVQLCWRGAEGPCAEALADTAMHMNAGELLRLRDSLRRGLDLAEAKPQLTPPAAESPANGAYRMPGADSRQKGRTE